MSRKVLVLYAHPSQHRSEVNQTLFNTALSVDGVTCIDLYAKYPNYQIDVAEEQQRLLDHDAVVFLFPLYWYSTPAILKEWQDLVLEYGFAYGRKGTALHGKLFFCAASAGGPEYTYQSGQYNNFTLNELLQPLQQMANLTGMVYLPPMALFSARTATEEGRVTAHAGRWKKLLEALVADKLDIVEARQETRLNTVVERLEIDV